MCFLGPFPTCRRASVYHRHKRRQGQGQRLAGCSRPPAKWERAGHRLQTANAYRRPCLRVNHAKEQRRNGKCTETKRPGVAQICNRKSCSFHAHGSCRSHHGASYFVRHAAVGPVGHHQSLRFPRSSPYLVESPSLPGHACDLSSDVQRLVLRRAHAKTCKYVRTKSVVCSALSLVRSAGKQGSVCWAPLRGERSKACRQVERPRNGS